MWSFFKKRSSRELSDIWVGQWNFENKIIHLKFPVRMLKDIWARLTAASRALWPTPTVSPWSAPDSKWQVANSASNRTREERSGASSYPETTGWSSRPMVTNLSIGSSPWSLKARLSSIFAFCPLRWSSTQLKWKPFSNLMKTDEIRRKKEGKQKKHTLHNEEPALNLWS